MYWLVLLFVYTHFVYTDADQCLCSCSVPGYTIVQLPVEYCTECEATCHDEFPKMDCGAAEHFEHSCETDPASWTGKYEFESHTCDPSTCCCPKGAKITKGDNQTLTVEITCAKYKIKDTQRIENHQIYYTLGNSSGVLIVSAEGVQYINADGACSAFGERKNTATVIVGVIMGLVMFFLLAGIGVFVWYRNRAMLGESAPLRV